MPHRIVIIDPLQETCKELSEMLRKSGHTVVDTSSDYTQGVGKVTLYKPTVVFIHLLPDRGPALFCASSIRSVNPKVPLVIISSIKPDRETVQACKEIKVNDFIVRPFSFDRIYSSMNEIKVQEESHKRGSLVCVGFTPPTHVRMMVSQFQLEYLFYPTCHLGIQCFRQNRKTRLICLIIQQDLEMYSQMLHKKAMNELEIGFPPWKQVILEAQIAYQEYWQEAIKKGLLPQYLPCLYLPRKAANPWLLPENEYQNLKIQFISNTNNFKQIVPTKIREIEGTPDVYPEMAKEVNVHLDNVEREIPNLIYTKAEETDKPKVDTPKKIEKSKGVVPKSQRKKHSRMIYDEK